MVRYLIALMFLALASLPAKAFDCVPTQALIAELMTIQPPPKIARVDPQLVGSFISGMREMGNITSPVPAAEVTGLILVSTPGAAMLVVVYEVGAQVCGAVRLDKNMAVDILRRGADA